MARTGKGPGQLAGRRHEGEAFGIRGAGGVQGLALRAAADAQALETGDGDPGLVVRSGGERNPGVRLLGGQGAAVEGGACGEEDQ
ncbi:hypothetical protein OG298_01045 [Streptomyces sp. NBC_01005]|uniref:hypothetical protein n=1 Tax=unclassified Streptomyces TaxID=2593676 RepID=UPI002E35B1B0|nr:hypothetical protein [Streptomyces sp. NBC_01362]WSW03066.1 hypothetical protein OG298_01045 [Streptomyces sp. NBC_01005]WTC92572.1 hypothetical protein OH736_01050 [Streptomyces sp. NBC_01650]